MQDVDQLLHNAQLRNELERYADESMTVVDTQQMTTGVENEYLESLLAWERAPVVPIGRWFDPELTLPRPETLDDQQLMRLLHQTMAKLFDKHIVLEYTGHLSDRQLYCLIARSILPEYEKQVLLPQTYLHWQCIDPQVEEETWLRYYADGSERVQWQRETGLRLPPREPLPFPRILPRIINR